MAIKNSNEIIIFRAAIIKMTTPLIMKNLKRLVNFKKMMGIILILVNSTLTKS